MGYNGYASQEEFHNAMREAYTNPESDYQKMLYAKAMERHDKGLPVSWDHIVAPMPEGVVHAGSYAQVHGDILGGSGD